MCTGPAVGLVGQIVLLGVFAGTVGLGPAGWLVGSGYGLTVCLLLVRALRRADADGLSPADRVTLSRALLVGAVAALVADSLSRPVPAAVLVTIAVVALTLDAVDGRVARHTGTVTAHGARFDMETDAFLILVLSVYVAPSVGSWVLAIGVLRYAYLAATWVLPFLRGPLPPRYWRKVVAAVQGIVLVGASAHALPGPVTATAAAIALALLLESFGRDVVWRWQDRTGTREPAADSPPGTVYRGDADRFRTDLYRPLG